MKRLLAALALLAALTATPALADECATVTVSRATFADIPKLEADAACFQARADAAKIEADAAQKKRDLALASKRYRVNRIAELQAQGPQLAPVADGLDVAALLGPKSIPPSAAPDVVGAFRFHCGPGQAIVITIMSPPCWDGVNLDSPDHRSHMAGMIRDASTGWVNKCPATHPMLVPQFSLP